jgi:hypothetical protein
MSDGFASYLTERIINVFISTGHKYLKSNLNKDTTGIRNW